MAAIAKLVEDEKIEDKSFFKGSVAYSDVVKDYVTIEEWDGKSEKCKVKCSDDKIVEHVYIDLMYEITIVFVIETAMMRMKLHNEPTTVEMTVQIHSPIQEAVSEVEMNTDIMAHRVHFEDKLVSMKKTFAQMRIKPAAYLTAYEIDTKAPLHRWHRLAVENIADDY